jgi:hypothetical protein
LSKSVIVHLLGADPVLGQVEKFPDPVDSCIMIQNPKSRDGKTPSYLATGVNSVVFPLARVNYIELLGEEQTREDVLEFFREDR